MAAPMKDENTCIQQNEQLKEQGTTKSNFKEGVFFAGVAGISLIGGFSAAVARSKKKDPAMFAKGALAGEEMVLSGTSLGLRALGLATVISVTGVSLFCFIAYKLSGAKSFTEFHSKLKNETPKFPKKESTGRNEFGSIKELVDYILAGGKG